MSIQMFYFPGTDIGNNLDEGNVAGQLATRWLVFHVDHQQECGSRCSQFDAKIYWRRVSS